ncbi:MAG: phosphoribosylglycinamide formyltransferase, partial [Polaromonas sp.]|nr:phosphoribosylglycinamide formyltransferase [Polaromonas sp.]
ISNRPAAPGWVAAQALGLQVGVVDHRQFGSREAFDAVLQQRIDEFAPSLVVLAGFMRILTAGFVQHYSGRLVNIHPSLLPDFTGLNTHQRALDAGRKVVGFTVHAVTVVLDHGAILAQAQVPFLKGDTPSSLAGRVKEQEHRIYPAVICALLSGA